jgi:hypothetical protein
VTVPAALQARSLVHVERMKAAWADELEARRMELHHRQASRVNGPLLVVSLLFACSVPA